MPIVLIVDDEPHRFSAVQDALDETDYEFATAGSGGEARAFLEINGGNVDTVLLDWVLPDEDGLELLRWIRRQPVLEGIEVVIQSAEMVPERIQAGIDEGAYYYLTKPYVSAQLHAIVRAAASSCRMKRQVDQEVAQASDALRMLVQGTFEVRTVAEAEVLAVRLAAACHDSSWGLGLLELLVNAIEHGNLGITYEEKSRLLAQGRLREEIERRLELPENRDKRATVEVSREDDRMHFVIRDCGRGFDYRRYLKVDPERMFDTHGRGILLAGNVLELQYVAPGNQVRASIRLIH